MSPPGARGPPGRGAPSPRETRPAMDRTASLPNLGTATAAALQSEGQQPPLHQQVGRNRNEGRQSANDDLASPTSPTIYGAPNMCRRVPNRTPVPETRAPTARTPENSFSTVVPPTRSSEKSSVGHSVSLPTRPGAQQQPRNTLATHTRNVNATVDPALAAAQSQQAMTGNMSAPRSKPKVIIPEARTNREARISSENRHQTASTAATSRAPIAGQHKSTESRHQMAHTSRAPITGQRVSSDSRHQTAPISRVQNSGQRAPITGSPAPPRTAAYDSPAHRSNQSSISGSTTSLTSEGYRAESDNVLTPLSPTSMDIDRDFQAGARALRRRRSPDETTEEAKRHCVETVRKDPPSQTFADAVRRTPSPQLSTNPTDMDYTSGANMIAPNQNETSSAKEAEKAASKKNKRPRYPPLVVEKLPNWATHFRGIAAKLGRPPNARPYGQGVRFSPESEEEYRVVQKYLTALEKEIGISWFAYSLPADKKLKVAIRGLPADTNPQEIEEELRHLGYEPEYVRHINARQGRPGCVFHAVLTKTENVRAIFDTTVFMMMRGVIIEAWRGKRGPAQCHRCQQFRHSSHQCHRPLACVRCGEGHVARECPRPREEPATCANCGGPHPANNTRCPIFQREIKQRRVGTVAITTAPARRPQNEPQENQNQTDRPQEEAQGTSLMAPANGPTQRGQAASLGRKKKRGGGKGKRSDPPATQEESANQIPTQYIAQAANQNEHTTSAGDSKKNQLADKTHTKKQIDQSAGASQNTHNKNNIQHKTERERNQNKNFTACAIQLLMDLIKAIRQGQDVEQVILDGLAALLTLYHE